MSSRNKAYLLTGSNLGNVKKNLEEVIIRLKKQGINVLRTSSVYKTAAWGKENQPDFMNQVLCIQTKLSPEQLLETVLLIEKNMGRIREEKYGPRKIDIDILLFGYKMIRKKSLIIPHPALPSRRFALTPLAEIAPRFVHPSLKKTIQTLLKECPDQLPVKKMSE